MTSAILSSTTMPSLTSTSSAVGPATEDSHEPSRALEIGVSMTAAARHQAYHHAPTIVVQLPAYVLQGLSQMDHHASSEHRLRDATIGIVAENVVEIALARSLGATPAGLALLTATVVEPLLRESLPSMEEIGRGVASSIPSERRAAEQGMQGRVIADILALPRATAHAIAQLVQDGFELFGSSPTQSTAAETTTRLEGKERGLASSSVVSYSVDEVINFGRARSDYWEIVRIRVLEAIDASSAAAAAPMASASESTTQSSEEQSSEGESVQWTGVQVQIPLDQIRNTRISTGAQFGSSGQYQTGVSTTLSHPVRDLQVSTSVQVSDSTAVGASTSLRHPVRDLHASASTGGFAVTTSLRHPAKDVVVYVPVTYLVGVQIPLKKVSQARVVLGVPLIPGASVSVPLRTVEKVVEKVVKEGIVRPIDTVVTRPVARVAREVRRFGRKLGFR